MSTIRIGNTDYEIVKTDFLPHEEFGQYSMEHEKIFLSNGMSEERRCRVLAHEILHALIAESGVNSLLDIYDDKLEEAVVDGLEYMFSEFLVNQGIYYA